MKYIFISFFILSAIFLKAQDLPEKISKLKVGLRVKHFPSKVYAIDNRGDIRNRGNYLWKYATTVETIKKELEIVEFGGYIKVNGIWKERSFGGKPFTSQQFSDWYSCKNGILKKNEKYSDNNNWSTGDKLGTEPKYHLPYYIAKDRDGKLYVGYAKIKILPKVKKEKKI